MTDPRQPEDSPLIVPYDAARRDVALEVALGRGILCSHARGIRSGVRLPVGPRYAATVRLRSQLYVQHDEVVGERHPLADEDVHFARALVAAVLEDLTRPGDRVLDPFVGFGTTLAVAEALGRRAVGVETLPERCAIARAAAPASLVVQGEARHLTRLVEGPFDLVLTSPPYLALDDGPEDPLSAYTGATTYDRYLTDLRGILAQCLDLLTPQGHLVVNVANIHSGHRFTPLAWDVGRLLDEVGRLTQDAFVCWDSPWHDLAGDYLLVARRRAGVWLQEPPPGDDEA